MRKNKITNLLGVMYVSYEIAFVSKEYLSYAFR